jgi:hypothetical protein
MEFPAPAQVGQEASLAGWARSCRDGVSTGAASSVTAELVDCPVASLGSIVFLHVERNLSARLGIAPSKNEPAIERGRPTVTTIARLDSKRSSHALDDIAEANIFIGNKTGQVNAVRLWFMPVPTAVFCLLPAHGVYFLMA